MLSHNINPVLFKIGFVQVTYYALVYIFGILIVLAVLLRASRKKEIGLKEEEIYDFLVLCIFGLLVGARAFHILFWDLDYFLANPIKIFYIWEGGLSFHGGFFGVAVVSFLYSRFKKISLLKIADILVIPIVFILALGRIANFINQEIAGTITNVLWCFNFEYSEGCRHPVQLYASFGRFALFFFLLSIKKKSDEFKDGFIFWNFVFFIGLGRFLLDFLREDVRYFGLAAGQWFALAMLVFGAFILTKNYKRDLFKVTKISRPDVENIGSTESRRFRKTPIASKQL